jgi:hypothetical protein
MAKLLTRDGLELKSAGNVTELEAEGKKITNLGTPTNASDAATKDYVDNSSAGSALDGTFRIRNTVDDTKQIAFDASGVATATTRTIVMPNANVDLGLIASAIQSSEKGANNGVATLNASGKLTSTQVPAIAIVDTFVVASEAAMIALSDAEKGDVAVRTDVSKTFILAGDDYATLADWQELLSPTDAVSSVNGQTGTVSLDSDDIAEGSTNLYYTSTRFDNDLATKDTDDLDEGSTNLYFTEARVLGTDLAGLSEASDASVVAADTVLQAIGKLQARTKKNNLAATSNPAASNDETENYQVGSIWYNQTTNKLYIAESVGEDAAAWVLINEDGGVTSVNGETGTVDLNSDDIDEGITNLYFTDARAKSAAVADSITDAVTDVAPSQNAVFDALALKADASDVSGLQADIGKSYDTGVAGEAMAANQIWLVRRAKDGETAGRYYKAQANSAINSRVVGFIVVGATAVSAADSVKVYKLGAGTLGSSDSSFAAADINLPIYLHQTTAGKWVQAPTQTLGSFIKEIGFIGDENVIEFQPGILVQA